MVKYDKKKLQFGWRKKMFFVKNKKNRRNPLFAGRITALSAAILVFLSGCSKKENIEYDVGSYGLSELKLDGAELEIYSVYPSGAGLYLSSSGSALLILGEESCSAGWTKENSSFSLSFGNMRGTGSFSEDKIKISFEDTGLEYEFVRGEKLPDASEQSSGTELADSRISGEWHGRMWFENPEGEWADYEYRSMELTGQAIVRSRSGSTESGSVSLFNSFYSETDPVVRIDFEGENGKYFSSEGVVMSYPVHEYEMQIDLADAAKGDLRDTLIIEKPGDYGHVFTPEEPAENSSENEQIPVLRLSGTCRDSSGSFEYFIELER